MKNYLNYFILFLLPFLFACNGDEDDLAKLKDPTIDISSEFNYSTDLPAHLTFDGERFWVAGLTTSKMIGYHAKNKNAQNKWGKDLNTKGLYYHNDKLYYLFTRINPNTGTTTEIQSKTISNSAEQTLMFLQRPGSNFDASDIIYDPGQAVYITVYNQFIPQSPSTNKIYSFNPNSGALGPLLWDGKIDAITAHRGNIWIAQYTSQGSLYTGHKIHKVSKGGNILQTYDLSPSDGGKTTNNTLSGLAFKSDTLWYLNGGLLKIVKSDIVSIN